MSDTIQSQGESWIRLAWYQQQGQDLSEAEAELAALREAVAKMGAELRGWDRWFMAIEGEAEIEPRTICPFLIKNEWEAVNANPIAAAAVRGTDGKEKA